MCSSSFTVTTPTKWTTDFITVGYISQHLVDFFVYLCLKVYGVTNQYVVNIICYYNVIYSPNQVSSITMEQKNNSQVEIETYEYYMDWYIFTYDKEWTSIENHISLPLTADVMHLSVAWVWHLSKMCIIMKYEHSCTLLYITKYSRILKLFLLKDDILFIF